MDKIKIYGLFIENSDKIRYVGKTKKQLNRRLTEHLSNANRNTSNTYKENWIRKTLKNNQKIKIILLEECLSNNWEEREKYWINKLKKKNKPTNSTDGGEGGKPIEYKWSYEKLKKYIQSNYQTIKSSSIYEKEFSKNHNKNKNIPSNPEIVYKNRGWISWGDFLGTNRIQSNKIAIKKYLDYESAKKIVKDIKINSSKDYKLYYKNGKIPNTIPQRPSRFYIKRGWTTWGDFLGTDRIANQNKKDYFFSFEECKNYLNKNFPKVNSTTKFRELLKSGLCSDRVPTNPSVSYKNVWISFGNFIGTDRISDNNKFKLYYTYEECKRYVQNNYNFIKSSVQWEKYWKFNLKPDEIPLHPDMTYKNNNSWNGWGEFLNTDSVPNYEKKNLFLTYNDFVHYFIINEIKFNSALSYRSYYKENKRPNFIPASPDIYYRNKGWSSWNKFIESLT